MCINYHIGAKNLRLLRFVLKRHGIYSDFVLTRCHFGWIDKESVVIFVKKIFIGLNILAFSHPLWCLPFTVSTKTDTTLPSIIYPGMSVNAFYTVANMTAETRKNNFVKYLPPNVQQVTTNTVFSDTCGTIFDLAPKGEQGSSCTLQLNVSGPMNGNDPDPHHHLFVCYPAGKTCAGTLNSLNVQQGYYGSYGQLVSSQSAGDNLTKNYLQSTVTDNIACPSSLNTYYPSLCDQNKYYLNNDTIFGFVNPINIDNFVLASNVPSVKRTILSYTAPGLHPSGGSIPTVVTSGLILTPTVPSHDIKGIVLYFHPTVSAKTGTPSGINNGTSSSAISSTEHTQEILAAIYASAGYIVLAPDYLGQGQNSDIVHSHNFYAQQQSTGGLYMIPAAKTHLQQQGINFSDLQSRSIIYAGFSEGGNYAVWASYLSQNSLASILSDAGVQLKHTFGMEGIYDYTQVMLPFFFDNVANGATAAGPTVDNRYNLSPGCVADASPSSAAVCGPGGIVTEDAAHTLVQVQIAEGKSYLAVDLNTYLVYSGTNQPYSNFMRTKFVNQQTCINPDDITSTAQNYVYLSCTEVLAEFGGVGTYNLPGLFLNNGLDNGQISNQLNGSTVGSSNGNQFIIGGLANYTAVSAASANGQTFNSVQSFVNTDTLSNELFLNEVLSTDSYKGTTSSPIDLLYMRYDQIVSNKNTAAACNTTAPSLYTNSAAGLVNCVQDPGIPLTFGYPSTNGINNTNLWDLSTGSPLYLFHGNFEPMAQLITLQILNQ